MRIISGKFRRRAIHPPKNFKARPTTDIAKESLFNILENEIDIKSLKVLDLFSGTGNISYEFASRGAKNVTSVELNYHHYSFIKKTVQELQLNNEIKVNKSNAFVFMKRSAESFDLIFADPPYDLKELQTIPDIVFENNLLKPDGILIVEHSDKTLFSKHKNFTRQKTYGSVNFSFFTHI